LVCCFVLIDYQLAGQGVNTDLLELLPGIRNKDFAPAWIRI
jgi:hypothetical protein